MATIVRDPYPDLPPFQVMYAAITARDERFDGQFFTAVRSTGIYCRPSCPAMKPRSQNVDFYPSAAGAQEAGYRPCYRCIPDATPGSPLWNVSSTVAARAMRLIEDGVVDREGVLGLARRLGYTTGHLNRVLTAEFGAGPLALARAHRAQTARALLTGTALPASQIAFMAGFSSVRQFNDVIAQLFGRTPTQLRAAHRRPAPESAAGEITLTLPYRKPLHFAHLLTFLAARAVRGVEAVDDVSYTRTLDLPGGPGIATVTDTDGGLRLTLRLTDLHDVPAAAGRIRRLFDLNADPRAIDERLGADPRLAAQVERYPGLRVAGSVDAAESLVRAIVGQQITVKAASGMLSAMADEMPDLGLDGPVSRLFPSPALITENGYRHLRGPRARAECLRAAAGRLAEDPELVHHAMDVDEAVTALTGLRGVGPWTANYVAMRVLGAPDMHLPGDVAVVAGLKALGIEESPAAFAEQFRPWRSYLTIHLWNAAAHR